MSIEVFTIERFKFGAGVTGAVRILYFETRHFRTALFGIEFSHWGTESSVTDWKDFAFAGFFKWLWKRLIKSGLPVK